MTTVIQETNSYYSLETSYLSPFPFVVTIWLNLDFILWMMSKDVLQISSDTAQGVCTSVVAIDRGRKMSSLLVLCCSGHRQSIALSSVLSHKCSWASWVSFFTSFSEVCFWNYTQGHLVQGFLGWIGPIDQSGFIKQLFLW